jgi:hypothetical protein
VDEKEVLKSSIRLAGGETEMERRKRRGGGGKGGGERRD